MNKILAALTVLAAGGTLFSGYLSYTKLVSGQCALGQACPFVLGYPACVYGFVLFVLMLLITLLALNDMRVRAMLLLNTYISLVGIAFSGWLVIGEWMDGTLIGGSLGISSCVYGLAMYVAILFFSRRGLRALQGQSETSNV